MEERPKAICTWPTLGDVEVYLPQSDAAKAKLATSVKGWLGRHRLIPPSKMDETGNAKIIKELLGTILIFITNHELTRDQALKLGTDLLVAQGQVADKEKEYLEYCISEMEAKYGGGKDGTEEKDG